jgi:hypothetical protein
MNEVDYFCVFVIPRRSCVRWLLSDGSCSMSRFQMLLLFYARTTLCKNSRTSDVVPAPVGVISCQLRSVESFLRLLVFTFACRLLEALCFCTSFASLSHPFLVSAISISDAESCHRFASARSDTLRWLNYCRIANLTVAVCNYGAPPVFQTAQSV